METRLPVLLLATVAAIALAQGPAHAFVQGSAGAAGGSNAAGGAGGDATHNPGNDIDVAAHAGAGGDAGPATAGNNGGDGGDAGVATAIGRMETPGIAQVRDGDGNIIQPTVRRFMTVTANGTDGSACLPLGHACRGGHGADAGGLGLSGGDGGDGSLVSLSTEFIPTTALAGGTGGYRTITATGFGGDGGNGGAGSVPGRGGDGGGVDATASLVPFAPGDESYTTVTSGNGGAGGAGDSGSSRGGAGGQGGDISFDPTVKGSNPRLHLFGTAGDGGRGGDTAGTNATGGAGGRGGDVLTIGKIHTDNGSANFVQEHFGGRGGDGGDATGSGGVGGTGGRGGDVRAEAFEMLQSGGSDGSALFLNGGDGGHAGNGQTGALGGRGGDAIVEDAFSFNAGNKAQLRIELAGGRGGNSTGTNDGAQGGLPVLSAPLEVDSGFSSIINLAMTGGGGGNGWNGADGRALSLDDDTLMIINGTGSYNADLFATGGAGGDATGGSAQRGGQGGTGTADLTLDQPNAGRELYASVLGAGGQGGGQATSASQAQIQDGATGTASMALTSQGLILADISATGGQGGTARHTGAIGGLGGMPVITTASGTAQEGLELAVNLTGGAGGDAYDNAQASGDGRSVSATNIPTGWSASGPVTLSQSVTAGGGGWVFNNAAILPGRGGDASSTLDVTAQGNNALSVTAEARGGFGGFRSGVGSGERGDGGDSTAFAAARGLQGEVTAVALSYAGAAGNSGSNGLFGTGGATALATTEGARASATATTRGDGGTAHATARSQKTSGLVRLLEGETRGDSRQYATQAAWIVQGNGRADFGGDITVDLTLPGGINSKTDAFAIGNTPEDWASLLANNATIDAMLGDARNHTLLGGGVLALTESINEQPGSLTATTRFQLDVAQLTGADSLLISFLDPAALGTGFDDLTFAIYQEGVESFSRSFADIAAADALFDDNWLDMEFPLDLGGNGLLDLELVLTGSMPTSAGQHGYGLNFGISAFAGVPGPAALPLLLGGLAALAWRRRDPHC